MKNREQLQKIIWEYYRAHGRDLPWRRPEQDGSFDPYKILVSEMMLQQTQVSRVIPKYLDFVQQFPTPETLAKVPLSDVLTTWSGLGYNRRAKHLHDAVKQLIHKDGPWKVEDLTVCKGIGLNTAAAVMVYAYNQSLVFVETNIRTVFIHQFFATGSDPVADKDLLLLIEQTMDKRNPREWYWALMDYGAHLKATVGNAARASKHYAKQSTFEGSRRQIRGQVLQLLIQSPRSLQQLKQSIFDERLDQVIADLETEELIKLQRGDYRLAS